MMALIRFELIRLVNVQGSYLVRILNALALCCVLVVGAALPQHGAPARASVATAPRVGPGLVLPGSTTSLALAGKYPRIAAFGHFLHMISNTGRQANYWSISDTASSASPPALLGATDGDTEHADATIAAAPDGTLYAAWIFNQTAVIVRRKPVNRAWESGNVIYWSANYLSYVDIAVAGDGQIFVVWKEDDLYRYARSSDGGAGWPDAGIVSSKTAYKPISIAGGAAARSSRHSAAGMDSAYASIWNGSKFLTSDLTPFASDSDFFAFAEPAVAPNGKIYVAFSNGKLNPGLYYSERQPDGSWPVLHLTNGRVYGAIGFSADAENNLHIAWASDKAGQWELYYAFKPDSGDWQDMIKAPRTTGDLIANVNAAATIGARAYGHVIFETFDGANGALRYQQFSSDLASPDATPVLDGGARLTRNTLVTLGFTNVIGSPDSMRYRWDAPPTGATPGCRSPTRLPSLSRLDCVRTPASPMSCTPRCARVAERSRPQARPRRCSISASRRRFRRSTQTWPACRPAMRSASPMPDGQAHVTATRATPASASSS